MLWHLLLSGGAAELRKILSDIIQAIDNGDEELLAKGFGFLEQHLKLAESETHMKKARGLFIKHLKKLEEELSEETSLEDLKVTADKMKEIKDYLSSL
jgi:hypothetical protein